MPKLPLLTGWELIKLAIKKGFVIERQRGSHVILSKGNKLIVIPIHGQKHLKTGLTLKILKEIEVSREELHK